MKYSGVICIFLMISQTQSMTCGIANGTVLDDCVNGILVTEEQTEPLYIICPNTCATCNINCQNESVCDSALIFSGASSTSINFGGVSSGSGAEVYLGDTGIYPGTCGSANFTNTFTSFSMDCGDTESCSDVALNSAADFTVSANINCPTNLTCSSVEGTCGLGIINCTGFCTDVNLEQCQGLPAETTDGPDPTETSEGPDLPDTTDVSDISTLNPQATGTNAPAGRIPSCGKSFVTAGTVYNNCSAPIEPKNTDLRPLYVICTSSCLECNVNCNNVSDCDGAFIFSGASSTNINVYGVSGLASGSVYVGDIFSTLVGVYTEATEMSTCNATEFEQASYGTVNVNCFADGACEDTQMGFDGNFDNVTVTADGMTNVTDNADRIGGAELLANFDVNTTLFSLNCGLNNTFTNCNEVILYCLDATCECVGECAIETILVPPSEITEIVNENPSHGIRINTQYLFYIFSILFVFIF